MQASKSQRTSSSSNKARVHRPKDENGEEATNHRPPPRLNRVNRRIPRASSWKTKRRADAGSKATYQPPPPASEYTKTTFHRNRTSQKKDKETSGVKLSGLPEDSMLTRPKRKKLQRSHQTLLQQDRQTPHLVIRGKKTLSPDLRTTAAATTTHNKQRKQKLDQAINTNQ